MPNKLFEYGLMNLPVIASKLPNMLLIMKQYGLGKLVDENNTSEQIDAINDITNQPSHYSNVIKKHFIWDRQKETFLKLMNE